MYGGGEQGTKHGVVASWPGTLATNPFVGILADGIVKAGGEFRPVGRPSADFVPEASALLIQWPDQIFWQARSLRDLLKRAIRELRGVLRWRRAGKTLIWIVHNTVPHGLSRTERIIWRGYSRVLSRLVHGYMTLSPATQGSALAAHPSLRGKPFASFRHPAYEGIRRDGEHVKALRGRLGIEPSQVLISTLGMLKRYKGIDVLVDVFKQQSDESWRLLVAGSPKEKMVTSRIKALATGRSDILVDARDLSDDEFADYLAASDRLVAPYRGYLHSGYLVYTVSAARMVLTPSTPFARDLAAIVGEGWVNLYEPPLTPAILKGFVERREPIEPPDLGGLRADHAGTRILDFVRLLRDQPHGKPQVSSL